MEQGDHIIDINADLGEGIGPDHAIMPMISSCNIACGGHAGDMTSMRSTIQLALDHNVAAGAHPSFPDRDNFGRVILQMSRQELTESIFEQILTFSAVCEELGAQLHHIKLHGALYNYAAKDAATSDAVIKALEMTGLRPILYLPYNSVFHRKAEHLFPLAFEAFIDRRYEEDGSLRSRQESDAVIHEPELAWKQLQLMVTQAKVMTVQGHLIPVKASTFCLHSDHPNAVEILNYIRNQMSTHGIVLNA
ncbi:hypothetical protein BST85_04040 [Aureitalea marina]|uniref:Lactam utilization protein LamB n=1 Tax=Aureitalea marina TaxID=930804 RepID=A0A2S7KTI5_9FLAO|nr:hypothetical protein BST85_04040 [Aureitalea marina]